MDHSSSGQLPPLDTLRAFEAAARGGSFSAAASALNLTHGAVSRQVAKLEHWLGLKLFDRQARGVALTPEGQRLYLRTVEAFALIADTSDRWTESRGSAVVRLSSIPSICGLWLMPRLTKFESGQPSCASRSAPITAMWISRMKASTLPSAAGVALSQPHLAAALRGAMLPDRLAETRGRDRPWRSGSGDPARLLEQPLIHDSDAAGWRAWFMAQNLDYRPRAHDRRFEDYNLVLDAAMHGLGVALARPPLAEALIQQGRLVAVDSRKVLNPTSYWLDRPPGPVRDATMALTRRIAQEAGVAAEAVTAFLAGRPLPFSPFFLSAPPPPPPFPGGKVTGALLADD